RHPIVETVERTVLALAQATHGVIGIDRHHQRGAELPRLVEVGHVAAVQDVEHAVGEHERARQHRDAGDRFLRARDLGLEAGSRRHTYSNRRTTRTTPEVFAARRAAASASWRDTMPMRYTTPRSVTTFTLLAGNSLASTKRALTLDVISVSFERSPSDDGGPTTRSFCTLRTRSVLRAMFATPSLAAWSGTSPVSRTTPL